MNPEPKAMTAGMTGLEELPMFSWQHRSYCIRWDVCVLTVERVQIKTRHSFSVRQMDMASQLQEQGQHTACIACSLETSPRGSLLRRNASVLDQGSPECTQDCLGGSSCLSVCLSVPCEAPAETLLMAPAGHPSLRPKLKQQYRNPFLNHSARSGVIFENILLHSLNR